MQQLREHLADTIRQALDDTTNVYPYVTASPTPPAVAVVAADPYLAPLTIGTDPVRASVRLKLVAMVAHTDTVAAQVALDSMLVQLLAALPTDVQVDRITSPGLDTVGPTELLLADVDVQLTAVLAVPEPADTNTEGTNP